MNNEKDLYSTKEYFNNLNKYWNATNYLAACQLYLVDNPILERKLVKEDIKDRIVGHWGTVPGQNFIYVHLNRIINKYDTNMIYISGPGHGGNFFIANSYIEGTYTETYPKFTKDKEGLKKLYKQFSFPGGVSSHVSPECPGSIHEGGELGYSLAHAFGTVMDNKDLIAVAVVGDGEAETGSIATGWQGIKFINPKNDGVVLPILHLNGYKISNPTVLARTSDEDLDKLFSGIGYEVHFVEGNDPNLMHPLMAQELDKCIEKIKDIQSGKITGKITYPMIILRTPKGWTGPKEVNDKKIEDCFRAHQVPITIDSDKDVELLEDWLRSYKPEELFDSNGHIVKEIEDMAPKGNKRISANPVTNGGLLRKDLILPNVEKYGIKENHGQVEASDMSELGGYLLDVYKNNPTNFRFFGPDEALSNRLNKVFTEEKRSWNTTLNKDDEFLSNTGRVMDGYLSENMCEGWLEGYILSGRHGFFHTYESFIRVVDSMVSQHGKWIKVIKELPWRKEISSLNIVLASHVWQQDHNGYSHQDPGFSDHLVNKKANIINLYFPADSNTLIQTMDYCLKTTNQINAIVASKHLRPQWLSKEEAKDHFEKGISEWKWASTCTNNPDLVMACCGETPTLETLAAVQILNELLPDLKIRVINIVDLMKIQSNNLHPHGLNDEEYDNLFTKDKPIIFAYHGYPSLIRELTYYRTNRNLSVHGYEEEGTITTTFDVRVMNKLDRYHLVIDALNHINCDNKESLIKQMEVKLSYHHDYIREYGKDIPEVVDFKWKR